MKRIILTLVALTLAQMSLLAQLPVITNQPPSRTVWAGSDVTLSVGASGTGVSTYQWLLNGVALPTALVKVVAGGGTNYPADGGAATNADVEPVGIAADASGNLFVSDGILVRKIDRDGIITTIAGGGTNYPGDGLPATGVSLSPTAIAVDTMGDLYLADSGSFDGTNFFGLVRKVDANGVITTVAGGGTNDPGDGGPATNAYLDVGSIALDTSGNLFIAGGAFVRKVNSSGIITTISAFEYPPAFVNTDAAGNLYVAINGYRSPAGDPANTAVYKVTADGTTSNLIANAYDFRAPLPGPVYGGNNPSYNWVIIRGIAMDAMGDVYIAQETAAYFPLYYGGHQLFAVWNIYERHATGIGRTRLGPANFYDDQASSPTGPMAVNAFGDLFFVNDYSRVLKMWNTQGPFLSFTRAGADDSGDYQVVITGLDGNSVTSRVATLTVATQPLIYNAVREADGGLALFCVSPPNSTNVVQTTTNLSAPGSWQPLSTNLAGPDGDWQFTDTNTANSPARFYRSATLVGP